MSFENRVWRLWRNARASYQRFEGRLSADSRTIEAHCEKSEDGETWELDFDLRYIRTD